MSTMPVHLTDTVSEMTSAVPEPPLAAYAVTFAVGVYTHWHSPQKCQRFYLTESVAMVHIEGHTARHLTKDDFIAPGQPMAYVAYQQATGDPSTANGPGPVAPTTYAKASKENH